MKTLRLTYGLLQKAAKTFPAIVIHGPRQSGKTTLAKMAFPKKPYISLEDLDHREFANTDPRGFLAQFPHGAILDEAQRCPKLFSYLQGILDQKKRAGLFILTGSQQFNLLAEVTQSLAGRVAIVTLLPFSQEELANADWAKETLEEQVFTGGYPAIFDRKIEPPVWQANYVATYIERDVRQLLAVRDLADFQRFLKLCAGRTGQLLNLSSLANDCGIKHNTARSWISVLEASYLVHLLPPHYENFNKRLVKTPKLYFYDSGLAAWLLGIRSAKELRAHAMRGALFETWAIAEILKQRFAQGLPADLYFWRDRTGNEVDALCEHRGKLYPIEIKAGSTLNSDFFSGLHRWREVAKKKSAQGTLLYGGNSESVREGVRVVPWNRIHTLMELR